MGDRVSGLIVRTIHKDEETRDVLYTLRNVLHVEETEFGYVVTFEEPIKTDYADPFIKACQSFAFVEKVDDIEPLVFAFEHVGAFTTAKMKALEAFASGFPKIEDYVDDLAQYAADVRAWRNLYDLITKALDDRKRSD